MNDLHAFTPRIPTGLMPAGDLPDPSTIRLFVSGMDCGSCAAKVENAVRRIPNIEDVLVSIPAGTVTVKHRGAVARSTLAGTVMSLGFGVSAPETGKPRSDDADHPQA